MSQTTTMNPADNGVPAASGGDTPRSRLRDFPDWLGPMLVKDLRQSLRSRSFVAMFILLQGFICLTLLMSMAANGFDTGSGFYWSLIYVVLVVALPLRGLGAVSQERTASMLELIALTKLNAWRIVFGKWAALSALTLLVFVCLVPCVMLRYFAVGVSVADEAFILVLLTIVGLTANAVAVAASCFAEKWARGLIMLALLFFGIWSMGMSMAMVGFSRAFGSSTSVVSVLSEPGFWVMLAMAPVAVLFFLSYGAGLISDPAENHSTLRRLGLLLVLGALAVATPVLDLDPEVAVVIMAGLFAIAITDAATDPPRVLARVARPFRRTGLLGMVGARFVAPGWHTAPAYAVLLALAGTLVMLGDFDANMTFAALFCVLLIGAGTVLWGTVVDRLMYRHDPISMPRIALIQTVAWITSGLAVAAEEDISRDGFSFSVFIPHAMFINLFRLDRYGGGIFGSLDPGVIFFGVVHFVLAAMVLYALSKPIRQNWTSAMQRCQNDEVQAADPEQPEIKPNTGA